MDEVFIAGVGMTPFGRHAEQTVKTLTAEAVSEALADAGASLTEVDAAFFANTSQDVFENQTTIAGQVALRAMGFEGLPIVNVENACASASSALFLALTHLRAGMGEIALAVGVERMNIPDQATVFKAFDGGMDIYRKRETLEALFSMADQPVPEVSGKRTLFMDIYAAFAQAHMKAFGSTQRQFAAIAAKNHHHSTFNDKCQFRKDMSIEEVLAGRALAYPLTVPMCSPMSDGAAAAILCTKAGLARLQEASPVKVRACRLRSSTDRDPKNIDWTQHIAYRAAQAAYEEAGVSPKDINVAEVHDATAVGEVIEAECLQLYPFGESGPAAERGETSLGGRIPINPSGGLECRGHPIGATGLAQIYELVTQLRGRAGKRQVEGARLAIAENGGGVHGIEEAACVVTILEKCS